MANRRRLLGLIALTLFGFAMTGLHTWQTYSAPYDCIDDDGHGPDIGTNECNRAIEFAIANRSADTMSALVLGLKCVGILTLAYGLVWLIAVRIEQSRND
jgi:hypothetical protein